MTQTSGVVVCQRAARRPASVTVHSRRLGVVANASFRNGYSYSCSYRFACGRQLVSISIPPHRDSVSSNSSRNTRREECSQAVGAKIENCSNESCCCRCWCWCCLFSLLKLMLPLAVLLLAVVGQQRRHCGELLRRRCLAAVPTGGLYK